ncbi:hypothetical protein [Actinomadura sp. HBU206391]|uniref:hypothetical protein n=1 Tax=Actinomadura sp. HBU206391 TaxID=2731692 RepID=UPI00165090A3|nr:hypothetical protein [Actinomadura sp. HBU206391]MBC6458956.1 hypothetical protein [Actinomadura sp. HBU206391]
MPKIDLSELYAEVESRAFPKSWTNWEHRDLTVTSNAGGHSVVLAESGEFWDDDDGSAFKVAWEELEPLYRGYVAAATTAWGKPRQVDITHRLARGESSPFTELLLMQGVIKMPFWNRGERALGLAICQTDKETAIQVIAVVVPGRELRAG